MTRPENLSTRDAAVLWHPYTQHATEGESLPVVSAAGAWLTLADGRRILDAVSSWWVTLHGHGQPEIAAAVATQAREMEQVIFAGFTHEPAVALAEGLAADARALGMAAPRVFYSDDGSTAVEVALKIAFQFFQQRGETKRRRFIALHGAYHGDTLGAMAVGEPEGFHAFFRPLLPPVDFVPPGDLPALGRLLRERPGEHAAFIFEPLLQGAGGMRIHSAEYLAEAVERCRAAGILCVADEVFTGFHRTGPRFACQSARVAPDLLCLSKGVTGGFLPLGVTVAAGALYEAFLHPDKSRAFLHGHSFTGSPLACAAALKSREILDRPETRARIREICERTAARITELSQNPRVANARFVGTVGAIDLKPPAGDAGGYFSALGPALKAAALERGVLLRPLGNTLYAVPPYCVTDDEIDSIYEVMGGLTDICP